MQTLAIAEDSNADLRQKSKAEEQARKSSDVALKGVETSRLRGSWLRPRSKWQP